jgi:hypothetical protein
LGSRNTQNAAALLITLLQLKWHGEVIGKPKRYGRQRLAKYQGARPRFQQPFLFVLSETACGGLERLFGLQSWVGLP